MLGNLFASGRSQAVSTIPLFPLRTVLFPGGLLPLKVFEQRYVEMTKRCMKEGVPFGVVMITLAPVIFTAFVSIPFNLERHPGEVAAAQPQAPVRHMS